MGLRFLLLAMLCLAAAGLLSQSAPPRIEVDPTYDAERLVREVFANDRCQTIFNIKQIGSNPDGIGYFSGSEEVVGFERGIILSTGKVKDAAGPNKATNTGSKLSGPTPDPDLDLVASQGIFDRSGLEFDFVPLESEVTFRYVFASEEYCEFVGAAFNDVFGFFISGPGFDGPYFNGAENVALIPGTKRSVSINNVNYRVNKQYYLDNESVETRQQANCGGGTTNGPRFQSIEYDGQTVILTATLKLEPCATYHIRLLVADVNDSDLDSAVFLEAGSFDLGASASLESEEGGNRAPIVALEGCTPATMRVVRGPDSDIERDQNVTYRVARGGTATDSVDFSAGSGSVTIPAGETFAEVAIQAYADSLVEGDEVAWLLLDVPCACYTDSVKLIIREPDSLQLGLGDPFQYCPTVGKRLTADVSGGLPPYSYEWSFGSTEAEPEYSGSLSDTISLRVTDACGLTQYQEVATQASDPPTLTLPEDELIACWGEVEEIPVQLTGSGPFTVTYRLDGRPAQKTVLPDATTAVWPVTEGGTYQVIRVDDQACGTDVNEITEVHLYNPVIDVDYSDPTCFGLANGTVTINHLTTVAPYRYRINDRVVSGPSVTDLTAGTYRLEVTDSAGCQDTLALELVEPDSLQLIDFTCRDLRLPPLRLRADGGQPPYSYSVDGGEFSADLWNSLQGGETYDLTIRDANGCELERPDYFYPQASRQAARLPSFYNQDVGGSVQITPNYLVPAHQIASYRWEPAALFDCPSCPSPTVTTPFTQDIDLTVVDIFGCVDSLGTYVAVDDSSPLYVPNAFTPDGDGNNDYMAVFASADLVTEILSFTIYTRWGELVFSDGNFPPNSARRGWDGQFMNREATSGTYVWTAEYRLYNGEVRSTAGSTILLGR
ncbi:gliding motility-associated-like protein [Lewinella marina]|uniref:Calx-beta domain-containing protein n=1 Tax=Neolewinella marina TaxID=438751 RepID=A0A2G0CBH4_9BACT|nr:choice-of-anchor L domain-containing protein [Neolewinella marina]NJB87149.1 gliding motility-associated-like protein [Neolewinella marina]PHK97324.1 hypothetical protein CGL56_16085 [Neolewinella marina]